MRTVIFDFDGTIADTMGTLVGIYNRVAPTYGCKQVDPAEIPELRKQRPQDVMRRFGVRFFNMPWLLRAVRREMKQRIDTVSPQPYVLEAIKELHARGYIIGMLTSNTEQNARHFLQQHGVEDMFSFLVAFKNLFGKDRAFRRLLKERGLSKDDVVYIGDETRDVEAAKRAGIPVIAVAWGFNAKEALEALHPDRLIEHQDALLPTIVGLD